MTGVGRRWVLVLAVAFVWAVRSPEAAAPQPAVAPLANVDMSLLLIGDTGAPLASDPVLTALSRALAQDPGRRLAVFLGDNIYPRGLPPEGGRGRRDAERRLDAQLEAVRRAGSRAVFVPGNHDWEMDGARGWDAVRRQASYVEARGGPGIVFLPRDGCPGPKYTRLREALEAVFVRHPPRVYVAGHEHSLQVLRGRRVPYLVVSGAGSFNHTSGVERAKHTLFAQSRSGFVRLDLARGGGARLAVFTVNNRGEANEVYAHALTEAAR